MAATGTITISTTVNGSPSINSTVTRSNNAILAGLKERSVAAGTNTQFIIAIDVSQVTLLYIKCSKDATIKTNSSGAPDNTLSVKADEPVVWWSNAIWSNPLTVDVTKIFVTVASGTYDLDVQGLYTP